MQLGVLGGVAAVLAVPVAMLLAAALGSKTGWLWTVLDCTPALGGRSQGVPRTEHSA